MATSRSTQELALEEEILQLVKSIDPVMPEIKIDLNPSLFYAFSQNSYAHFFKVLVKTYSDCPENDVRGLPDELWLKIYTFLDTASLVNCMIICKGLRSVGNAESIRKRLYDAKEIHIARKAMREKLARHEIKNQEQETSSLMNKVSFLGEQLQALDVAHVSDDEEAYNDGASGFVMKSSKAASR